MRITMIILKAISIIFAGLPLIALGIFILLGGPDPGSGSVGEARIVAILFLCCVCFFVLPNRIVIRSRLRICLYGAFCLFAVMVVYILAEPNTLNISIWMILPTIIGIISGALSLFFAISFETSADTLSRYVTILVIGVLIAVLLVLLLRSFSQAKPKMLDIAKFDVSTGELSTPEDAYV